MLRVGSTLISEAALEKVLSPIHLVVENGFSNRLLLPKTPSGIMLVRGREAMFGHTAT